MGRFVLAITLACTSSLRADERPKLAVLIVFDQLRGDYLLKWQPLFGPSGFNRLMGGGATFVNCHYPYATTSTGPGHASMLSGCSPERHGIVNNEWYDAASAEDIYCASHPRYQRVPPAPPSKEAEDPIDKAEAALKKKPKGFGSPDRMLAETVGDTLRAAHGAKSKIYGLSLKDRSAILPVGKKPDGAFWFESTGGQVVTSTYYRDRLPSWVEGFNQDRIADLWFGRDWTRLRPTLDYARFSGPDDAQGEGKGVGKKNGIYQGTTFPHPMTGSLKEPGKTYYETLANSPFGNDLLLELTKRCVIAEKLGQHEAPDLLTVSFSSNDLIGHCWGPDSQEVLDVTLRSDEIVRDLLAFLDQQVGVGKYVVGLTADHGICPLPEATGARVYPPAGRVNAPRVVGMAESYLTKTFGKPNEEKARWIETVALPWVYLNPRVAKEHDKSLDVVAKALADWLSQQPGLARAYTRQQLEAGPLTGDAIGTAIRRSYYAERSGDVYVLLAPYCLAGKGLLTDTGTSHGTPYEYDQHVPLLVYGPGVPAGPREERVTPQALAAIFADALGVPMPKQCEVKVPETLKPLELRRP